MGYREIEIENRNARTARIALCDDFNQAALAEADGCDIALVYNTQTQSLHDDLLKLQNSMRRQPIRTWFTRGRQLKAINERMSKLFAEAGFLVNHRRHTRIAAAGQGEVHNDETYQRIAVLSTKPTTILFLQDRTDENETLPEQLHAAMNMVTSISPILGSVAMLLSKASNGGVFPHCIPDIPREYWPRLMVSANHKCGT